MKKLLLSLLLCLSTSFIFADSVFIEGFEYGNHDNTVPVGWTCNDDSWLSGYLEKDHNRIPHSGNWYAYTETSDSWMFMELYMSEELKYRYHFWGISDGTYDVEFWAGSAPSTDQMATLLFTKTVSSGEYERFSEYVETIAVDYQYFGIHAIAHEGAYCLTIDDIWVDMVGKYDLAVTPERIDAFMMPGDQITIEYDVQNTGYEDLHIYMTPTSTESFYDISFTEDGFNYSSFPTVANQVVHCTCTTTLSPTAELGSLCFLDIMFTVSCDCVTRMLTLWVTVGPDTTGIEEFEDEEGIKQVEVFDLTGRKMNPSDLKAGVYIERTTTSKGVSVKKFAKQ